MEEQNRKKRVCRALNKSGYALHKSRGTGGYMIADLRGNYVIAGGDFELSLDDAEAWAADMCREG